MVFNSIIFAVFFAMVSLIMAATNLRFVKDILGNRLLPVRHTILLLASYLFYGWWNWRLLILMLSLSLIAYACSLAYARTGKKLFVCIAVIVPLAALVVFKYLNFFVDSFAALFGIKNPGTLNIILPVGISFYTFQSLSYSIDVFRGKIPPEKSFLKLALYISFFPQLVAGPIVKAEHFIHQLYEDRNISLRNFETGIQYFVFGLFKKIVLADHLSVCVDAVFSAPGHYHAVSIIFAVIAYSIQIYFDFSGYSDMAIGCSKCLGYDLKRNFNLPYISKNVSEFWKRWHISLSEWLQEYLYIPLGGNRKGTGRTYLNLWVTMLIGGLWHGANWTFVAWGALHGIALCIHKLWMKFRKSGKVHSGSLAGTVLSIIVTYLFVCFCWIFFRADTFHTARQIIIGIFTWQRGMLYVSTWTIISIAIVGISTLAALLRAHKNETATEGFYPTASLNTIGGLTLLFIVSGLALILAYTGASPFIYFQF